MRKWFMILNNILCIFIVLKQQQTMICEMKWIEQNKITTKAIIWIICYAECLNILWINKLLNSLKYHTFIWPCE